uniref:F-box domain-containing protein n=1 Tax=Ganoderma boninense TaxID=34458 RepID=A0A5K1JVT1_9APHY|nr:Uncharacterized protein [Ganoderma boninense]
MSASALTLEPSALSPTSAMTSESAFPLEIYEHILDFVVAKDVDRSVWKRTLASTSLVCHGWHPRSRALLFRVLRFGVADEETLRRLRDHLLVAPHLAVYVEEVRLIHRPEFSRLLDSFPRWLAVYLPRLGAIFVKAEGSRTLDMHRFFCLPSVRETSEFEGLLLPYPNARVLTLHQVVWVDRTSRWKGKGFPRPFRVPLALTELRLMLNANGSRNIHIVNRLNFEYLFQACKITLSKLLLNLAPVRILTLQFQDAYPLNVIEFPHLDDLHLEIFMAPGLETRFRDGDRKPIMPYAEVISLIPRLLRRLNAVQLRILRLSFSAPDIDLAPDAFLDHLKAIHEPMHEMIRSSWFPRMKVITFDLGHRPRDIPSWQSRITTECLPELGKVVSIQVIPHDTLSEDISAPTCTLGSITDSVASG